MTKNLINKMYGEQKDFIPTKEAQELYNAYILGTSAILDLRPSDISLSDSFEVEKVRGTLGSAICTSVVKAAYLEVHFGQIKAEVIRLSKVKGRNKTFRLSVQIVENWVELGEYPGKGEQLVIVSYAITFESGPETGNCGYCNEPIEKTREWAKFCSDKCRQAAFRAHNKAKYEREKMESDEVAIKHGWTKEHNTSEGEAHKDEILSILDNNKHLKAMFLIEVGELIRIRKEDCGVCGTPSCHSRVIYGIDGCE